MTKVTAGKYTQTSRPALREMFLRDARVLPDHHPSTGDGGPGLSLANNEKCCTTISVSEFRGKARVGVDNGCTRMTVSGFVMRTYHTAIVAMLGRGAVLGERKRQSGRQTVVCTHPRTDSLANLCWREFWRCKTVSSRPSLGLTRRCIRPMRFPLSPSPSCCPQSWPPVRPAERQPRERAQPARQPVVEPLRDLLQRPTCCH